MVNDRRVISERHQSIEPLTPGMTIVAAAASPTAKASLPSQDRRQEPVRCLSKELHSNHQAEESQKQCQLRHLRISLDTLRQMSGTPPKISPIKASRSGTENSQKITDHKGKADNSDPHSKQIRKQL